MELHVHQNPGDVAAAAADRIEDMASRADGTFTLGLAGGSTPEMTYVELATRDVEWDHVDAWLSDERWVAPDHARCNGRMALEVLTGPAGIRLHRPRWSPEMTAEESAADYERTIRAIHADSRPDVVMLGIGDDGHTASLFPGTLALDERDRWYMANHVPQQGEYRLTATYPLLWSARLLMVLVVGAAKAEALRSCLAGNLPAGMLGDGDAAVEWLVDEEAASLVS